MRPGFFSYGGFVKRATDKLIALQFLAVVLPIAVVLLAQMGVDARRAASLEHSRPLQILAEEARVSYKTFTTGVANTNGTGTLGSQSVNALHKSTARLIELSEHGEGLLVNDAKAVLQRLTAGIEPSATLATLLPLRALIVQGETLTKAIDQEFEDRDEFVVNDAIASARMQKRAVAAALVTTAILTVVFVLMTRRRLKARIEEDMSVERRRRAELETISLRFEMASRAARAGVYEVRKDGLEVWWSDTMHELYAQSDKTFQPTMSAWLAMIHPDDRDAAQAAKTTALRDGCQLRSQFRVLRSDGSVCHIDSRAAMSADSIDASPRLVGIDLDITERINAEERERKLQRQLRDASRQAGMAEIATNVLHNVGNVLNSVNISASLVGDSVKNSRAAGLGKVVALLQQHEANWETFVTADPRGKHLPAYLAQLWEHLKLDQAMTLQEIDILRTNIGHIKEIVAMQQSYSKLIGVPETLAVRGLVEDALRMNVGAFSRHGVSVECTYEEVPEIVVEKHEVLQILINLLRNAKYACDAAERLDKLVLVRVVNHDGGVRITVADNGVGIRPEHMTQLFSHGFTTKKDGHGFGLHSGALAARDMGGALRAESAGPGQGATFRLDLPLKSPQTVDGLKRSGATGGGSAAQIERVSA
jgi:signal transduction histidine kinase